MNFKEILTNIARAIVDEPDAVNVEEVVKVSGRLQLKDGIPQIIADGVEPLEIKEDQTPVSQEQEYMGLIIPDDKLDKRDDILDILTSYEGNIPVIIAMKGKKYNANCAIR